MAQLSRGRAVRLALLAAAVLVAAMPAGAAVDLRGTWHVLVHYKDDASPNPDVPRWEDRVWRIEDSGSRLKWREWPIVVFNDESGRFERRSTGQYARILHHWEPNAGQQQNIRDGVAVNDRGSKSKSLRKDGTTWRSVGRARPASVMAITYQENWIIEESGGLPVFVREDQLGSESAEDVEGKTEYRTQEVREGGSVLVGTYERDGTRHGTFRMTRAGEQKRLAEKSQSEMQQEAFARAVEKSRTGIGAAPREAEHDDDVRYRLPFEDAAPRKLSMGVGGDAGMTSFGAADGLFGHLGWSKYSFDFDLPKGETVVASRDGSVILVDGGFSEMNSNDGRTTPATQIWLLHGDGTIGVYGNLSDDVEVKADQKVAAGDPLGRSRGPAIHFSVVRRAEGTDLESVDIRFADGSDDGFVPVLGAYYGGDSKP